MFFFRSFALAIIFIAYNYQMLGKHQLTLGSPKNVTLNVLNGNSFFTFDYENTQKSEQFHQTLHNFVGDTCINDPKHKNKFIISSKNGSYVKSAQYSRKLIQTSLLNRSTFNPYTRIKRVQELIEEKKQRQSSLENRNKDSQGEDHLGYLPQVAECRTQRLNRSQDKQIAVKSFTIDPEQIVDESSQKKGNKTTNVFSENYKNRRKLLDRVSHRRVVGRMSPLRWDSKPQDILQSEQKSKHWSPYIGKLSNRANDPLLKSIEGNRIRYVHHEPKYYKGKLQQADKL